MDENKIPEIESASDAKMGIEVWENRPKKKYTKVVILVIVGIILAFLLTVLMIVDSYLDKINKVEGSEPTISQEEIDMILSETDPPEEIFEGNAIDIEDVVMPEMPADKIKTEDRFFNILLVGQDRRPGEGRSRSDSMILCTINTQKKTLVMTSFLRDIYVRFPEYNGRAYSSNRLNVPYVIGGMEMLNDTLELNFGVHVDHNVEVDFSGFEDIIDILGGVPIELTYRESLHVRRSREGWNHLDGQQALEYARIRKVDNDFGRTNRQRKVLSALLEQIRNADIETITKLADQIFPLITTDMSNADILNYLMKIAPILPDLQVTTQHIPGNDSYYFAKIRGMSVIIPDLEECSQQLKDTIG